MNMTMNDTQGVFYKTIDMQLAAYLKAKCYPLVDAKRSGRTVEFVFADSARQGVRE
jgi:hypothetical protein